MSQCPLPSPMEMLFSCNLYRWRGWRKKKTFFLFFQSILSLNKSWKKTLFSFPPKPEIFKKRGTDFHILLSSYVLFHCNSVVCYQSLLPLRESYLRRQRDGHMPKEAPKKPKRQTSVRHSQWFSLYLLHAFLCFRTWPWMAFMLLCLSSSQGQPIYLHIYSMCGEKVLNKPPCSRWWERPCNNWELEHSKTKDTD